jgi:hypothetical protein
MMIVERCGDGVHRDREEDRQVNEYGDSAEYV